MTNAVGHRRTGAGNQTRSSLDVDKIVCEELLPKARSRSKVGKPDASCQCVPVIIYERGLKDVSEPAISVLIRRLDAWRHVAKVQVEESWDAFVLQGKEALRAGKFAVAGRWAHLIDEIIVVLGY